MGSDEESGAGYGDQIMIEDTHKMQLNEEQESPTSGDQERIYYESLIDERIRNIEDDWHYLITKTLVVALSMEYPFMSETCLNSDQLLPVSDTPALRLLVIDDLSLAIHSFPWLVEKVLAFIVISPQAPTQILIIPKIRDSLTGLSKEDVTFSSSQGKLWMASERSSMTSNLSAARLTGRFGGFWRKRSSNEGECINSEDRKRIKSNEMIEFFLLRPLKSKTRCLIKKLDGTSTCSPHDGILRVLHKSLRRSRVGGYSIYASSTQRFDFFKLGTLEVLPLVRSKAVSIEVFADFLMIWTLFSSHISHITYACKLKMHFGWP
ncbi:hypothetical protein LguiB_031873 [Lonicera macranthoides]